MGVAQRLASEHDALSMLVYTQSPVQQSSLRNAIFSRCCEKEVDLPTVATIAVDEPLILAFPAMSQQETEDEDESTDCTGSPLSDSSEALDLEAMNADADSPHLDGFNILNRCAVRHMDI